VAQQRLNGVDVSAVLKQMGWEGMVKELCVYAFCQTCVTQQYFDGFVDDAGPQRRVMPERGPSARCLAGKTLPAPFSASIGVLSSESMGRLELAQP
jgi:hypothetical protein